MDAIIAQVQALAAQADEDGRHKIQNQLRDLQSRVETPKDTFMRYYNAHLEIAVIYVGVELGLFKEIAAEKDGILTLAQLAEKTGAASDLLERILRYLSSTGHIENVGPNQFKASHATAVLADPLAEAMLTHGFGTCGPAVQAFPSFLQETKYQDITNNKQTAFQKGLNTELTAFQWMAQHPKQFGALQVVMTALQSSDWMVGFDLLDKAARAFPADQPEKVFLVDVGGGHGHQAVQIQKRYPNLHGHLVLQDLPEAVGKLPPLDGVKAIAHDFFEEQEIEGANFYYLRRIFHDWPENLCVKILRHLVAAMDKESRILIDEVVLPDANVHWHAAMQDISMGILLGGKERSRAQWEKLVGQAGLKITELHTYDTSLYHSIIVLEQQ